MLRPYKSKEEMFYKDVPMILFIRKKNNQDIHLVTDYLQDSVILNNKQVSFQQLFDDYEYLNGLPCGVEEDN